MKATSSTAAQGVDDELIRLLGEVEDLVALVPDALGLGQLGKLPGVLAAGVVDVLLLLRHAGPVLGQGGELALLGGEEEQQILQKLLMGAVVAHHAHLDLGAEGLPEGLVLLPVILLEAEQIGLDLLLQVARDHLELAGVLEHLTGDVEGEVLGVHHALDKAEVLGQQIGALVHDEHAGGVELEALLVLPGVEVIGGVGRDIEHGLVLHRALGGHVHHAQGILPVAVLLLIELVVLLRGDLALGPLPQGYHGVEGLPLVEVLPLGLIVVAGILGAGFLAGLCMSMTMG